jgi:hypothetical protein
MANQINFNIILVIVLLLIIIILLSSIKICRMPLSKLMDSRFIDTRYKYISEPFQSNTIISNPTKDLVLDGLNKIAQNSVNLNLTQTIDQEKQNRQINLLKNQISELENKMNVINQMM